MNSFTRPKIVIFDKDIFSAFLKYFTNVCSSCVTYFNNSNNANLTQIKI